MGIFHQNQAVQRNTGVLTMREIKLLEAKKLKILTV
jgi:hypothetical protein